MRNWQAWAVAALVWLVAPVADAGPELDRARAALEELRYEEAAGALDDALQAGQNSPAQLLEIYRMLGEVTAALGDREGAVAYFDMLLAVDSEAALRAGVSPKIMQPFDAARARAGARESLAMRCDVGDGAIEVTVVSDPLDMAKGAFQSGSGSYETAEADAGVALIVVSDTVLVEDVGLLDEHGNKLVSLAVGECAQEMAAPVPPKKPIPVAGDEGASVFGHWALWGGVAVGLGAAGAYFGLQSRSKVDDLDKLVAASSDHEFAEAQRLEDDARRDALFANIGFAAAGTIAVVSAILLYRSSTSERTTERRQLVVAPAVGGDGLSVSFAVPF